MNSNPVVDARGRLCPQPLMMMVRQMKEPGCDAFEILVDNATAHENICRMAETKGWQVARVAAEAAGVFRIALARR